MKNRQFTLFRKIRTREIVFSLFLAITVSPAAFHAQTRDLFFGHLTIKDGLSQNSIFCSLHDSRGFIWFGTSEGLNRYDGCTFTIYHHIPMDLKSLSNNSVRVIFEDREGTIWVGTEGGGLNRFNREMESFIRYNHDPDDSTSISNSTVWSILEDHYGRIWVGTEEGLNQFDRNRQIFMSVRNDAVKSINYSKISFRAIYEDRDGTLWFGTDGYGVFRYDEDFSRRGKGKWMQYSHTIHDMKSLSSNTIQCIFQDKTGRLWIGTSGGGLNVFDKNTGKSSRFQKNISTIRGLSNNNVNALLEDEFGYLWIGTDDGLNLYDPKSNTFEWYRSNPDDPTSIGSNWIYSLYQDRSGIIWVGNWVGGADSYDRKKKKFELYRSNPKNPNSLTSDYIRGIYEDREGILWVGTRGGLNKIDRKKGIYANYQHKSGDPKSISHNFVMTICEDKPGLFWIGTQGGGLNRFEKKSGTFHRFQYDPDDSTSLSHNKIRSVYIDKLGDIWIGTDGGGLNKFYRQDETFTRYQHDPNDPTSICHDRVWSILEDSHGIFWIGTYGGGLDRFDRETGAFTHYRHDPHNSGSISYDSIIVLYEDHEGKVWIGTDGGGLNCFIRETDSFFHYGVEQGLPNNIIYGILEDNQNNLWLSHNKGLTRFNPVTRAIKNYDYTDGLQSNEFSGASCHKTQSGELFFGGLYGLNTFYPEKIEDNLYIPPVVITNFQISNQKVPVGELYDGRMILDKSIIETRELTLSYKDRVFSFDFIALNFTASNKNQYAYMMEGFDKDWHNAGNRHFVSYTNLRPGNYVFRVKASNNDGVWNEEGASIRLSITPPFWQTWWFRGILITFVIGSLFVIYEGRTRNIKRRNRELEKHVEERTVELKNAMTELMVSNDKLKATTDQLVAVNTELNDFAYIVSHDLKAPLRGVAQLSDWILQDYSTVLDKEGKGQLQLLRGRVQRMDNLIDGILQYSRAGKSITKEVNIDLNSLVSEIISTLAPPKHITIVIENSLPVVKSETTKIYQVFQNLISNAIKYNDKDTGRVTIGSTEENGFWKFYVSDNGPGIDEKYHEKIFKIFQTLEARDIIESTGVGLSVVKKIIEQKGGRIWVESKVGKGSTFYFTI